MYIMSMEDVMNSTEKMSIYDIADVMREHKKDIMKHAKRSNRDGFRVMVEIENDGTWRGAGVVTPGTGSLLAHEGGFVCFFSCNSFLSYSDIEDQIWQWIQQTEDRMDAQEGR
jgi:hypothetical protein